MITLCGPGSIHQFVERRKFHSHLKKKIDKGFGICSFISFFLHFFLSVHHKIIQMIWSELYAEEKIAISQVSRYFPKPGPWTCKTCIYIFECGNLYNYLLKIQLLPRNYFTSCVCEWWSQSLSIHHPHIFRNYSPRRSSMQF